MKILIRFLRLFFILIIGIAAYSAMAADSKSAFGELSEKCTYPQQPSIPNGSKASKDEMLAAQKSIKEYQAQAQDFRTCIDNMIAVWDSQGGEADEIALKKTTAVDFYNKSVADEEQVADLFNTAIRAYKTKN